MYTFKAKHGSRVQNILLYKDMPITEFKNSLHALQYTSDLPPGTILGFKDSQGQFIPPLLVCSKPECFQSEEYEVIIRLEHHGNMNRFPSSTTNGQQNASDTDDRAAPMQQHAQAGLPQMYAQQPGRSNGNAGLQSVSTMIPGVTGHTQSGYGSSLHYIDEQQHPSSHSQRLAESVHKQPSSNRQSNGQGQQHHISPPHYTSGHFGANEMPNQQQQFIPSVHSHQEPSSPLLAGHGVLSDEDNELIQIVLMLPSDALEDNMKSKVIHLLRQKDKGIRGALISFQDDNDLIALRSRIIHKVLTPTGSREDRHGVATSSSATTAGFQQYHPSTAVGRERVRPKNYQDQYMPIIIDLEQKGMLEDQTASIIKTLVLEENFDVQQVLNTYINRVITDVELAYKLEPMSQALGAYLERPQSPPPKRKQDLMNQVNMLARYHFRDPDDVQLLQKLIHDENELILAVFDVYESDNNHENLIDSLQRILDKSKAMGIHMQSVTASSFFNNHDPYWQQRGSFQERVSSNNMLSQGPRAAPHVIQQMTNQMRASTPTANQRSQRNQHQSQQQQQRRYHPHQQYMYERPPTMAGQRYPGQRGNGAGQSYDHGGDVEYEFKPATTVHDVVVIPGYFSSGEEDHVAHQLNSASQNCRQRPMAKPQQSNYSMKYQIPQQYAQEAMQVSPTRQFSSQNHSQMSRPYKQSIVSSTKYGAGMGKNFAGSHVGGGPGYQFSHMHQSQEDADQQLMEDEVSQNILVSDHKLQEHQRRSAASYTNDGRQTYNNHHRSQSGDYYKPRQNPHQQQPSFYNMGKLGGGEKARSGAASMVRQPNVKRLEASDAEQDSVSYHRRNKKQNMRTYEGHPARYHFAMDPNGHTFPLNTDNFSLSNRFSGTPGVGSSIHKIHGQSEQSKKQKDKKQKNGKKDKKDKKSKNKSKNKSKKKRKGKSSSSSDSDSSDSSSSSSSSSNSSSSSDSSDSSSSSSSSKSSVSSGDKKKSKSKNKGKDSKKKMAEKKKLKIKAAKKDKKKGGKDKEKDKKDKSKSKDETKSSKSNKDKSKKEKSKEKDNDKDKKKSKKDKKSTLKSDEDLNDRLHSNRIMKELSAIEIRQIMEEEGLQGVMRDDAYIIFLNAVKKGLPQALKNVFKTFHESGGSGTLLSNVMSASEEMLQTFNEHNFSNSEIGVLYKLRGQRNSRYGDGFQSFSKNGKTEELVVRLKEIIEDELAEDAGESNSQYSSREQHKFQSKVNKQERSDQIAPRHRTFEDKTSEIFKMAFETDFTNSESGHILRQAFEDKDPELLSILQSYMCHNDYLQLKNALIDYANQKQSQPGDTAVFQNLDQAIEHFKAQGQFSYDETNILSQMMQSGNDRFLSSIWNAYQVISIDDDLLHSLKVLVEMRLKKSQAAARAAPPAKVEAPAPMMQPQQISLMSQQQQQPSGFSGLGGLIKLNAMPAAHLDSNEEDSPSQDEQQPEEIMKPADPFEVSNNNAGEMLDNCDGKMDDLDEFQPPNEDEANEEVDQAAQRLEQICRYSHKILRKYVTNGMITMQDGPQLHHLVEQRDYRIICILEVYSQNKNEDDFLENLGLLTQVIKEMGDEEGEGQMSFSDNENDEQFQNAEEEQQQQEEAPEQDPVQNDSFTIKIEEATSNNLLEMPCANWSLEAKKNENKRVVMTYNAYKRSNDLQDFAHSLSRLYKNATK